MTIPSSGSPAPSLNKKTRQGFMILTLFLTLLLLEGVSAIFFHQFGDRIPLPDPHRHLAAEKDFYFAETIFDAGLGWKTRYATPFGERPRAVERDSPLVSVYGDSFSHADEVEHHQSWSEQLGSLIDADVFNFGNGAYGTDQALLRFERDYPARPTPVVLFGFITNDIERNVSVYWRFLYPKQTLSLTKPRFLLEAGALKLLPNPAQSFEVLKAGLQDPAWVEGIGQYDWWYNPRKMPGKVFPTFRLFFEPGFRHFVRHGQARDSLWEIEEPKQIFELILHRLQQGVEAAGAELYVIHFPVVWEIQAYRLHGILPPSVTVTQKMCESAGIRCQFPLLATADLTEKEVSQCFTKGLEGGHYSVQGNARIAQYLALEIDFTAHAPAPSEAP